MRFYAILLIAQAASVAALVWPTWANGIPRVNQLVAGCRTDSTRCCQEQIYGPWWKRKYPESHLIPIVSTRVSIQPQNDDKKSILVGSFYCHDLRDGPPQEQPSNIHRQVGPFMMACVSPSTLTLDDGKDYKVRTLEGRTWTVHVVHEELVICAPSNSAEENVNDLYPDVEKSIRAAGLEQRLEVQITVVYEANWKAESVSESALRTPLSLKDQTASKFFMCVDLLPA